MCGKPKDLPDAGNIRADIKEFAMRQRNKNEGKRIEGMLWAVNKDVKKLPKEACTVENGKYKKKIKRIDTIVNSASPDLMGGEKDTVDKSLHDAIDALLKEKHKKVSFNQMICKELALENDFALAEDEYYIKRIRCPRGKAVLTSGYGFCKYVIHAVGTRFESEGVPESKKKKEKKMLGDKCCSSSVQILESCYHEVVKLIRKYPDIKNIAIPIIGSGNYEIDFEIAAKIAVSAVGNALMDWKNSDQESFNTSGIENIIFFVEEDDKKKQKGKIIKIIEKYGDIYKENHQVVFQDSFKAQKQYYNEILLYDENRGYFAFAGWFRRALVKSRMIVGWPSNKVKEKIGGQDWQRRRMAVEGITVCKLLIPVLGFVVARFCPYIRHSWLIHVVSFLLFYSMADTITYLLALIMMADIQKPSANVIRSLLLLFFNYVEVACGIAYFYYVYSAEDVTFKEALAFGILGQGTEEAVVSTIADLIVGYVNAGLKFFFVTVVFGYLVQHMRQRKFRGKNWGNS